MKRAVVLVVGVAISVVALWWAFKDFDLEAVWQTMLSVRLPYFLLLIVPYTLTFLTKVWRWQVLFHPDERRTPFRVLFPSLMISYIPLPFRLGEVARGVVAGRRTGLPVARVFSTIVVEKVLDVLTLLLIMGIALPFVDLGELSQGWLAPVGAGVLVAVLVMLGLVFRPDLAHRLVGWVAGRLPARIGSRLVGLAENVLAGLAPLSNGPTAAKVLAWSLGTWGINVVTVWIMMLAFNLELPIAVAAVLVVVTNLTMAIPAAPGYVGTFEAAVIALLNGAIGVPLDTSQGFALFYHFVGLVPVALMGVIAAAAQGVNFGALNEAEQAAESEAEAVAVDREAEAGEPAVVGGPKESPTARDES
jgi:glycosyltransferase 2 family protein